MNLCLSTIDVWTFQDEFLPHTFLRQLAVLLQDGDVIAVGAYNPSERLRRALNGLGASNADAGTIYSVCFELNREEHPDGRSFELPVSATILAVLAKESERADGQSDKPLFFDHLVAYRRGVPVVPLVSFHDAFYGGELHVSGLYSEKTIQTFAANLPSAYTLQRNPENYPESC